MSYWGTNIVAIDGEPADTITPIEQACGVTVADVARYAKLALRVHPDKVIVSSNIGPALAGAVARYVLAGPVEMIGFNGAGYPVYRSVVE